MGNDIPHLMKNLELEGEPLSLWWTADFINADPGAPGTPCTIDKWIVGEFNCSCVGISQCAAAYCKVDTPNASFFDIPVKDLIQATFLGNLMGQKALGVLDAKKNIAPPNSASKLLTRIDAVRSAVSL